MLRIHLTLLFCFSCQFALADEWVETKSDKGKFTIQLPGKTSHVVKDVGSIKLHIFFVSADMGNTAYMVMYSNISETVLKNKTTDQILDDAVKGAVRSFKGKLSSEKSIVYAGSPGRDFVAATKTKGTTTTIKWRILLVKKRMYQIGCVGVGKKVPDEKVDKIRASFKLLK